MLLLWDSVFVPVSSDGDVLREHWSHTLSTTGALSPTAFVVSLEREQSSTLGTVQFSILVGHHAVLTKFADGLFGLNPHLLWHLSPSSLHVLFVLFLYTLFGGLGGGREGRCAGEWQRARVSPAVPGRSGSKLADSQNRRALVYP